MLYTLVNTLCVSTFIHNLSRTVGPVYTGIGLRRCILQRHIRCQLSSSYLPRAIISSVSAIRDPCAAGTLLPLCPNNKLLSYSFCVS